MIDLNNCLKYIKYYHDLNLKMMTLPKGIYSYFYLCIC